VSNPPAVSDHGLVLRPFRAARPQADGDRLGALLCPPYDVIDPALRAELVARDPDNAVAVVLPEAPLGEDRYRSAAAQLESWVATGHFRVDPTPALYVYEMRDRSGATTRGLVGALELRDPADGVVLPHENTMAGPVADRLALMSATEANVEAIYLVYDGGGAASEAVQSLDDAALLARTTTADGLAHSLWSLTDPDRLAAIAADLAGRRALIADGHHRYATYRDLQRQLRAEGGPGPWDYGLTLLVDSSSYGPQVHAIHRVLLTLDLDTALDTARRAGIAVAEAADAETALAELDEIGGFAIGLSDGNRAAVLTDPAGVASAGIVADGEPAALGELDVTVLHRGMVERVWGLVDSEDTVAYAHTLEEALAAAGKAGGTAVLLRPTPVEAVAAVAAAGARMPRKSTLFTPKPASGLLMRRFADAD
jgi:uncharacterized protein (DUF1015 family)